MENHLDAVHTHTPDGCFSLEALEVFQSFEGQILETVNYYLWVNEVGNDASPYRFLFYLEFGFEQNETLILTSGEDSTAISISTAGELIETASALRELNNRVTIQRILANPHQLWTSVIGTKLESINLTPNEEKYYLNDSLMLDFGQKKIIVQLSQREGLELIDHG
jgi:hypothetical protein